MREFKWFLQVWVGLLVLGLIVACSTNPEQQRSRFNRNIDALELQSNKLLHAKADIMLKIQEFKAEFEKAGDDVDKLIAVNRRVERYMEELEKMVNPQVGAQGQAPVGSKVGAPVPGGSATGAPMPGTVPGGAVPGAVPGGAPMPGGKLGDPGMGGGMGAPMPGSTGAPMPGGSAVPVQPVQPAPGGGGGFGGQ